jgi:hypothetical protein
MWKLNNPDMYISQRAKVVSRGLGCSILVAGKYRNIPGIRQNHKQIQGDEGLPGHSPKEKIWLIQ